CGKTPPRQAPFAHDCPIGQTIAHLPQLFLSVAVFASQPFAGLPSQFAKAPAQAPSTQPPPWHIAAALGNTQAFAHPPQLFTSTRRLVSQPFAATPSQSRNEALHEATPHLPVVHPAVPLATAGQRLLHCPQLSASPRTLVSHPLATTASQSPKPVLQAAIAQLAAA